MNDDTITKPLSASPEPIVDEAAQLELAAKHNEQLEAAWSTIVRGIIARSKKIKPEDVKVPEGGGKYFKLALDKNGFLSTGRPHGRKKPHWRPAMNALKSRMLDIFREELTESYRAELIDAAREGRKIDEPSQNAVIAASIASMKQAQREVQQRITRRRHGAHRRQALSRRINFGLIAPNVDVRTVAGGRLTWADTRQATQRKYNVAPKPKPEAKAPEVAPAPGTTPAAG